MTIARGTIMASNDDDYYDTDAGKRALAHYISQLNGRDVSKRRIAGWGLLIWYVAIALVVGIIIFHR